MRRLSIRTDFDGKERLLPSLVPRIKQADLDRIKVGKKPSSSVVNNAVRRARKQIGKGRNSSYKGKHGPVSGLRR